MPRKSTAEPKSRRAHAPLSRGAIVDATLAIVQREGVAGATLRTVARALNTGAASLYVYVPHREELLNIALDAVFARVKLRRPPAREPWQRSLRHIVDAVVRALAAYPGMATVALGAVPVGPGALRVIEAELAQLMRGGIGEQAAAYATDLLALYAVATAAELDVMARGSRNNRDRKADDAAFRERLRSTFAAQPRDAFPHLTSLASAMVGGGRARYAFGLDVILAGLAAIGRAHRQAR